MTITFSNFSPKITKIRCFWFQIWGFLFLHQTLQSGKFQGADFKYDNSFSKIVPKHPNKVFAPKFKSFYFCRKRFSLWRIRECLYQIWQKFSSKFWLNTQMRYFWSQISSFFSFTLNLEFWQVWVWYFKNVVFWEIWGYFKCSNSFFFKCYPKNTKISQFWP